MWLGGNGLEESKRSRAEAQRRRAWSKTRKSRAFKTGSVKSRWENFDDGQGGIFAFPDPAPGIFGITAAFGILAQGRGAVTVTSTCNITTGDCDA
nr:hypothetical protein [Bradyrhizobium sp.]